MGVEPEAEGRVADGSVKKKAQKIFKNIHLESESSSEYTNNNMGVTLNPKSRLLLLYQDRSDRRQF